MVAVTLSAKGGQLCVKNAGATQTGGTRGRKDAPFFQPVASIMPTDEDKDTTYKKSVIEMEEYRSCVASL